MNMLSLFSCKIQNLKSDFRPILGKFDEPLASHRDKLLYPSAHKRVFSKIYHEILRLRKDYKEEIRLYCENICYKCA